LETKIIFAIRRKKAFFLDFYSEALLSGVCVKRPTVKWRRKMMVIWGTLIPEKFPKKECNKQLVFKGAQSRLNGLKSLAKLFNFVVLQSVSIFSILNHPCSSMLCYNLFDVFLSL